jgi:hypothetical protein
VTGRCACAQIAALVSWALNNSFLACSIGLSFEEGPVKKVGYLANMKTTSYLDQNGGEISALLMFYIQPNGQWFKCMYQYEPYFYLLCNEEVVRYAFDDLSLSRLLEK